MIRLFAAAVGVATLLVSCQPSLPALYAAPAFDLVDQEGRAVRDEDLRGRVWLVGFIFTNCTDICPLITGRMVDVQRTLEQRGLTERSVQLVSITVDPRRDTPAVLKAYAEARGANLASWRFLTGPEAAVRQVVTEGFKIGFQELPGSDQILHGGRLVLVDRAGMVRALYPLEDTPTERIVSDIVRLAG